MRVVLEEESLRDGLQAESRLLSLSEKMQAVRLLNRAGLSRLQLGSFVNPRSIPQMANSDVLVAMVRREFPDLLLTGLVLNERGLERAIHCGLEHVSMSVSVSDTHSRKNVGRSAEKALELMTELVAATVAAGVKVRAGVQCAFGCVYEGPVSEAAVVAAVEQLTAAGANEINLADTTGMANPFHVKHLVAKIQAAVPDVSLSLHLHDTRGMGLLNMFAGFEAGVRLFDVAVGGLGGCPFVAGAAGNVASEDAVNLFHSLGIETGIDLEALCQVVDYYEALLERKLPGKMNKVIGCKPQDRGGRQE